MSHVKRYILLAAVVLAACVFKFNNYGKDLETVGKFRGARLLEEDWNPLIAETVNDKTILLTLDSKEYTNRNTSIFMDDNLNLMVPVDILPEGLQCSSHLYDEKELLVEKRNNAVSFRLNDPEISVNDSVEKIASPMMKREGRYYVSIDEVSKNIGYNFEWNMEKNQAVAVDVSEGASIFPASYDLRKKGRVGTVKNQGNSGTCWAFAALSALESAMLPEENMQFSPDHMSMENSFVVNTNEGGEYTMAMAYLLAWQGPVFEKDDPFGDGVTVPGLSAVKHVQEMQIMDGKDYAKIKEAVFQYGGVQTSLYSVLDDPAHAEFYNKRKDAYCYIGTEKPNHEVVIIGWDDHYPKENFTVNVEGDGAFICQNSWGEDFGEDGIFYVSYYDTNIGSHNVVYTKVEDTDNYDRIYQSDLCGWVGQIGFNQPSVFGANVYTAEEKENLSAVGFYATGQNTKYRAYLVHDFENTDSFDDAKLIAEGSLKNAGYYTIPITKDILLEKGERYAVGLYVETPDAVHPMAIEYAADEATKEADLSDGEGYISLDGKKWDHVEEEFSCNLCIKAYTKK